MVASKPVIKSAQVQVHLSVVPSTSKEVAVNGYFKGKAPSAKASELEKRVESTLKLLGANPPAFLDWSIEYLLQFIKEEVHYHNSPPKDTGWNNLGDMLLENTMLGMNKSHPHIKSWTDLSVKEAIDFLLGVDVALMYKGKLLGLDITANPDAVRLKMEKVAHAFKEARMDVLEALDFDHYIVVLGKYGELDIGKLKRGLSSLNPNEAIASISLI